MSTVTKIFVVLLIVFSLLLTAGMVVYINREENIRTANTSLQGSVSKLQSDVEVARRDAEAARTRAEETARQMNTTVSDLQAQITRSQTDAAQRVAEAAGLRTQLAVRDATVTEQAGALKVASANLSDLTKRYDDVIKQLDQLRSQNVELVASNTDYQKRNDELESRRRFLEETIVQLRTEMQGRPTQADAAQAPRTNVPALAGVITDVRQEGNMRYASISLGATDRVERGMEFNVIDRANNAFLGKLTVESVQPNEAFGRLDGPRVAEIRRDHEVRTQL